MWRPLLLVFLSASVAFAAQQSTAYDALRVVGTQLDRSLVSRVISVNGTDGDPQPVTWRVLVADRSSASGVREVEVANGVVVAQRTPPQSVPAANTIKTSRLNLDSSGAFSVASYTADKSHANFALANYSLRNNERGEPVWIVTLQDENRRPIGTIHIGANRGNVSRVEGLYSGQNMEQAQQDAPAQTRREDRQADRAEPDDEEITGRDTDYDRGRSADEDDGDENIVKRRLKEMFYRSKRDAQHMFGRVRRSFEDFFPRN
ncbi:MAG: hypothetical protein ABR526_02900 [Chthoniobacterales bacterium]